VSLSPVNDPGTLRNTGVLVEAGPGQGDHPDLQVIARPDAVVLHEAGIEYLDDRDRIPRARG
jgi:hypothetical protein